MKINGTGETLSSYMHSMDRPWLLNQEGTRLLETRHFNKVHKKGESNQEGTRLLETRHELSHESGRSQQLDQYKG